MWAVLERPGALSFASELSALCQGGDVDGDLSAAAVDAFFVFGYVPGPDAILRGVRQLPPGHVLTWEPGAERAALRAYWSPPSCEPCPAEPRSELVAETRRLLEGSVRSRMIADVPLGVFLSGGVDVGRETEAVKDPSAPTHVDAVLAGYRDVAAREGDVTQRRHGRFLTRS